MTWLGLPNMIASGELKPCIDACTPQLVSSLVRQFRSVSLEHVLLPPEPLWERLPRLCRRVVGRPGDLCAAAAAAVCAPCVCVSSVTAVGTSGARLRAPLPAAVFVRRVAAVTVGLYTRNTQVGTRGPA